ncbi:MAG: hypothetical protein IPL79_13970 [Myxococcales bacterium]|nr:hypothetical protein [Myxococcales bacterium]
MPQSLRQVPRRRPCSLALWVALATVVPPRAAGADVTPSTSAPTTSAQLATYLDDFAHDARVRADVKGWHRTTRNSCVAFVATALGHLGAPLTPTTVHEGAFASRLTVPFASWLAANYESQRIEAAHLQRGDIVFAGPPEAPTHVYVFMAWTKRKRLLARVIDNQGHRYVRHVGGRGGRFSPFGFALRLVRPYAVSVPLVDGTAPAIR